MRILFATVADSILLAAIVFSILATTLWLLVRPSRRSHALAVFPDRIELDPRVDKGPRRIIRFDSIQRLTRHGRVVRIHFDGYRSLLFRGRLLHVEDAFEHMVAGVDATNRDCVIVDR